MGKREDKQVRESRNVGVWERKKGTGRWLRRGRGERVLDGEGGEGRGLWWSVQTTGRRNTPHTKTS